MTVLKFLCKPDWPQRDPASSSQALRLKVCVIIPRIFVLFKDNWVRYGNILHLCINRKISISNIFIQNYQNIFKLF